MRRISCLSFIDLTRFFFFSIFNDAAAIIETNRNEKQSSTRIENAEKKLLRTRLWAKKFVFVANCDE